jgi:calcium/calmodulin-dependent protein kinase I
MKTSEVNIEIATRRRIKALADVEVTGIESIYTLGDELGRGRFSVVQRATHLKEQATYAIKLVKNEELEDDENMEALETEISILRKMKHPYIVQLKEVVTTDENTYLVMELLGGGELFERIVEKGAFTEEEGAALFAQILLSMEYLHKLNIVHRDVKPENILYSHRDGTDIKLIDFGYAGIWRPDQQLTGLCGTPDYVAPEVLSWYDESDEKGIPYGASSDMWSMGVLLYVILSGCSPFNADEEEALLKLVAMGQYEFHDPDWTHVSEDAKDLISNLLVVDVNKRYNMTQALSHSWVKNAVVQCREAMAAAPKAAGKDAKSSGPAPNFEARVDTDSRGNDKQSVSCSCTACAIL